ncbi:hypothetical protein ACFWY5_29775 [Nonomuraea sp. NPDC059007]|uniref:hypothetical protein n=1 Tax=Nonomuraea sp. NPDC059007 TaxID=3346692 RepID=UPI00368620FB
MRVFIGVLDWGYWEGHDLTIFTARTEQDAKSTLLAHLILACMDDPDRTETYFGTPVLPDIDLFDDEEVNRWIQEIHDTDDGGYINVFESLIGEFASEMP